MSKNDTYSNLRTKYLPAALLLAITLTLAGCQDMSPFAATDGGPKDACNLLRAFGDTTFEARSGGSHVCRVTPGLVSVTVYSLASDPGALESVVLEGTYANGDAGTDLKRQMIDASNTLFARLNMDVPPGIAVAIQNRSQGESSAGRLLVSVEHTCDAECRVAIHVRSRGQAASVHQ